MYLPKHFEQPDPDAIARLLVAHPLATLAWHSADGLTAEHLPLILDRGALDGPHGTLRGHVARANPLWQACAGADMLAIFHGVQAYVSPSWYPSKKLTHKVVPTWNYLVLHAHGPLRVIEDKTWLHGLVSRLTHRHEAGRAEPWAVVDAPEHYIEQMLRAIVGIEIPVTKFEGKWKLSQNRGEADRAGTADGLAAEPGALAQAMAALIRPM